MIWDSARREWTGLSSENFLDNTSQERTEVIRGPVVALRHAGASVINFKSKEAIFGRNKAHQLRSMSGDA